MLIQYLLFCLFIHIQGEGKTILEKTKNRNQIKIIERKVKII